MEEDVKFRVWVEKNDGSEFQEFETLEEARGAYTLLEGAMSAHIELNNKDNTFVERIM